MEERKELSKLVLMTLSNQRLKAIEIYSHIKYNNPHVLRTEKVRGFKSFVKIINSFDRIQGEGKGTKTYKVKR